MHLNFRNVNDAFYNMVSGIARGSDLSISRDGDSLIIATERRPSRVGDTLQVLEPVTVSYQKPLERVLFNSVRDANPFFHLFESLWMLAGRNDVAPLAFYSSGIADVASDDGRTFNGAYGYRWRTAARDVEADWSVDQLNVLINHLHQKPESRRAVLQMWNVEDDLLKIDATKDVCCNTAAYFSIRRQEKTHDWPIDKLQRKVDQEYELAGCARRDGDMLDSARHLANVNLYREGYIERNSYLDMTVTNRSNDMIWGMLGANVVHFSFLQEYVACALGVEVGVYNQFTNNLHVYLSNWKPKEWLRTKMGYGSTYPHIHPESNRIPLVRDRETFDREVVKFVECCYGRTNANGALGFEACSFTEPFLKEIASKLCLAFLAYKRQDYLTALQLVERVKSADWQIAGREWITRRLEKKGVKAERNGNNEWVIL